MVRRARSVFLISCWALYDLANQFFALNIVSFYFVLWLTKERGAPEIFYSIAFGFSMLLVALLSPILGTISDIQSRHKFFLVWCTMLSVVFTVLLSFTDNVLLALIIFAIANFGCQMGVLFYNALLVRVSPRSKIGLVSGIGRMCGYAGAILALYFTKPIILTRGYQATFLPTGILFFIFALPCMVFIKDKPGALRTPFIHYFTKEKLLGIFKRLQETFREDANPAGLLDFFKASFFILCVANVIILFMSVYATQVFGLTDSQLINLLAFSTLFAVGGSITAGIVSDYVGYARALMGVLLLWVACLLSAALLRPPFHWLIGALAGLSLGATWVVFRALIVKLVPEERVAQTFGLVNLIGAILGPLYWGVVSLCLARYGELGYRMALFTLIVFIALGFIFLLRIPKDLTHR